jgi:hypothetical protein
MINPTRGRWGAIGFVSHCRVSAETREQRCRMMINPDGGAPLV